MADLDLRQPIGQVKSGCGCDIIVSTAPFSATTPTRSTYLTWQLALSFPFKLTVAEGWTPMLPAVSSSHWLTVLLDLGVIPATSLIFWLQTQSRNSKISSSFLLKSDSWEVAAPVSTFISCDFKASESASYLPSYFHCLA